MRMVRLAILVLVAFGSVRCASRPSVRRIPFELHRNQIVVAVNVNGTGPYSMIVDTGADPSAIDLGVAREAGVNVDMTKAGVASGVGSERPAVYAAILENVSISGIDVGTLDALAVDLAPFGARFGRPLQGVLGYSLLSGRTVRINYPARELELAAEARPCGSLRTVLPFRFVDDDTVPVVDILVNGVALPVSIDTGSSLSLELFPNAVERLGLEEIAKNAAPGTVMGARGEVETTKGVIDEIRLGAFVFEQREVTFSQRGNLTANRLGNIGNALLQEMCVTIDYTEQMVILERP